MALALWQLTDEQTPNEIDAASAGTLTLTVATGNAGTPATALVTLPLLLSMAGGVSNQATLTAAAAGTVTITPTTPT